MPRTAESEFLRALTARSRKAQHATRIVFYVLCFLVYASAPECISLHTPGMIKPHCMPIICPSATIQFHDSSYLQEWGYQKQMQAVFLPKFPHKSALLRAMLFFALCERTQTLQLVAVPHGGCGWGKGLGRVLL